ncbi:MAG: Ig-like domain-containing protein [Ginsengibacter sp.]
MKIRTTLFLLLSVGVFYMLSTMSSSCAQIGVPTGGVRDSLPPTLLKATPPNNSIKFEGKQITLSFDEYIQLQNLQENLLVSPTPIINPNIDFKLKTITIKLRDTLQPNTTYSLQLGKSIVDLNENNPYPNFTYVFSTGTYIDSLTFSGNVQLAESGKIDTTLLVLLYNDLSDSAVFKHKPKYITRVNNKGDFQFNNLAKDTYHLFAIKDESGQKMYTSEEQTFAFADSPVVVSFVVTKAQLYAYAEKKKEQKPTTGSGDKKEKILKYTTSISNGTQDILTPLIIKFITPLKNFDSSKIKLTDTLFTTLPSSRIYLDTTFKEVTVQHSWEGSGYYKLILDTAFATDTFGLKLAKMDTISFRAKKESDYGSLKLNFKNLEKFEHPVLQFIGNGQVVKSIPLTSKTIVQKLFDPGEYDMRILDDTNQNGVWDPGHYDPVNKALQKQPEKVFSISQLLKVRANWDNDVDVVL